MENLNLYEEKCLLTPLSIGQTLYAKCNDEVEVLKLK